jgi:hypothetical protein
MEDLSGMGMNYQYAGSASYPRFDRELCAVAEVFGGIKTEHLKERETTESERPFGYFFGFLNSDDSDLPKFVFPEGTNEVLIKWFNDIYGDFNKEETKIVWEHISTHPEIKEISNQIWNELKQLVKWNESWFIY